MTHHPRPCLRTRAATSVARLLRPFALTLGLLAGGVADAAPTVLYTGGFAVGVDDLVVQGVSYDISFVFGSYDAVFATSAPTFLGDTFGARLARDALWVVMEAETAAAIGIGPLGVGILMIPMSDSYAAFPDQFIGPALAYEDHIGATWKRFDFTADRTEDQSNRNYAFAIFTAEPQNTVPEPASLALAGLGLVALGLGRRRRLAMPGCSAGARPAPFRTPSSAAI